MILVVTDALDPTANAVVAGLEQCGARWGRFNQAEFPERAEVGFDPADAAARIIVDEDGDGIPLEAVRTVWNWHPTAFKVLPGMDRPRARFVAEACGCACRLVMDELRDRCFMVNDPAAEALAEDKGVQLRAARRLGFDIPETLVTNSPARAREFCAAFPEVVFKVLNRPRIDYGDRTEWICTRLLSGEDIGALDQLRHCPGIFQRRIPKRFDLRVTVVGARVFSVEIHSQGHPEGEVDFRLALAEDPRSLPHAVHDLPPPLEARVLALTRRLGLSYCALDLVVTPSGDYVFLEVNPSGQYGWLESLTGLPITRELARMLMRGAL